LSQFAISGNFIVLGTTKAYDSTRRNPYSHFPVIGAIMRLNKKPVSAFPKLFAVTVAVLFVAYAARSSANPSPANHAVAANAAPQTTDSTCRAVLDALDKNFTTPYHMYMTQSSAAMPNGKPVSSEMVFAGGSRYVLFNGKWTLSPMSTEEMKAASLKARQNAKILSCHYVKDESVNGETAALFATHGESEHGKDDNQIWISKSKGLILKQETDLDTGAGRPKTHMSVRYEYTNVQAPRM
jgi:hypothetical protein